jgi:hypothetical protein
MALRIHSTGLHGLELEVHTVQLCIEGKNLEKEGKIEGIIFRNRGQIEGILKGNREQNPFVSIQYFKGPAIPKHRLPNK